MTATVWLLCGKPGSGKTTFARDREHQRQAIRLSPDDWTVTLFEPHMPRALFDQRLAACKAIIFELAERLLAFGLDVSLDFGFWSRAERDRARRHFEARGFGCELVYFPTGDDELRARLAARNRALPPGTYEITDDMFDELARRFEPLERDEPHVVADQARTSPRKD